MAADLSSLSPEAKRALLAGILKERASRPRLVALSMGQQRLWRLIALEPGSPVYNIGFAYDLEGPLDVGLLEGALRELTRRDESLRAAFAVVEGVPMQVIAPEPEVRFERVDLRSGRSADWPAEVRRRAREVTGTPIDLTRPPLWRFTLLERSEHVNALLINTHHIISDRWSIGVLVQDLAAAYTALVRGEAALPARPAESFGEAIRRLEAAVPEPEQAEQLAYWREQFRGEVRELILPTDLRPATAASYRGRRQTFVLPVELSARLNALAARERVTAYVALLAAVAVRLRLDTGQTDLVLAAPVAGRHHAATRGVVGYFNNLLPIRLDIPEGSCFRDLLHGADRVLKGAFGHQDVPFQRIADQPGLDHISLTRCVVALQNVPSMTLKLPGIESKYEDVSTDTANFDLALFLEDDSGTFRGFLDAKADLWSEAAVDGFLERFLELLEALAVQPDRPIAELAGDRVAGIGPRPCPESPPATRAAGPVATGAAAPIQNELERRMIAIWEDVLRHRPLGPGSNFFALGGHSLLAARLFERIGRAIGRELPLSALLQAPTIRQLSDLILSGGDAPCWAAMVPIQPRGTRPPLFCVHGGGGGVLNYLRLAERLGPDQPLWGLQAADRDEEQAALGVEEMAEQYLQAVRTVQSEGPYHLVGHSFGGLIAFEMARQLSDQGHRVALLVIIDHPGPGSRITLADKVRWHTHSLSQLDLGQKVQYIIDRVKWNIRKNPRLPTVLRRAADIRVGVRDVAYRLRAVNATMTAMRLYQPGPYSGRLTLVRARVGYPAINTDPFGGWAPPRWAGSRSTTSFAITCKCLVILMSKTWPRSVRDCLDRQFVGGELVLDGGTRVHPTGNSRRSATDAALTDRREVDLIFESPGA